MYKNLGLQLYSVRNHMTDEESVRETFKRLAEVGYTEAQTAGAFPCSVEAFADAAKQAGITIVGTHYGLPENVDDVEEYVNIHKTLGTNIAGIGGINCTTIKDNIALVEKINRLAENLSKYGMKFSYHHHSHEFAKIKGDTRAIDILVDGLDPKNTSFVLDTYWLQNSGAMPCQWIEKLAGRVDILHLKDRAVKYNTNEGFITEIGNGNLDFGEILKTAETTGVKYICVEQDTWPLGFDSIDCVAKSSKYLHENFLAK